MVGFRFCRGTELLPQGENPEHPNVARHGGARLRMLALAEQMQNISLAWRRAGISRSHFYEIKDAFENYRAEGLAPQPRTSQRLP